MQRCDALQICAVLYVPTFVSLCRHRGTFVSVLSRLMLVQRIQIPTHPPTTETHPDTQPMPSYGFDTYVIQFSLFRSFRVVVQVVLLVVCCFDSSRFGPESNRDATSIPLHCTALPTVSTLIVMEKQTRAQAGAVSPSSPPSSVGASMTPPPALPLPLPLPSVSASVSHSIHSPLDSLSSGAAAAIDRHPCAIDPNTRAAILQAASQATGPDGKPLNILETLADPITLDGSQDR